MTSALKIKESGSSGRRYTADGVQITSRQSVYDQDEIGNRVTSSTPGYVPYTVNDDNQYTVMKDVSLTYDPAGNLLTNGSMSYSWDNENRLTRMVSTNLTKTLSFTYDYQGRRIEKKVWNNTTGTGTPATYLKYIYDGMNLVADYDAVNCRILRTYTYGPGVDNIQSMTIYDEYGGSETYYYIKDASNTVHVLVDEDGLIVEYYYYDAFGNLKIKNENYQWISESNYGNRFLFQGREYDYDTALYYFRARWYEPETGRWLSPDPIGISGGLNLYTFCGNDPVNFVDFLGWNRNSVNTVNIRYTLQNGDSGVKKVDTLSSFISFFNQISNSDNLITKLTLIGHGALDEGIPVGLFFGNDDNYCLLTPNDESAYIKGNFTTLLGGKSDDMKELLKALDQNASVNLYFCYSATTAFSINLIRPDLEVVGYTDKIYCFDNGWWFFCNPGRNPWSQKVIY